MTSTPVEIGTLIVVILKAKNLPNKRHIGKQDPYCSVKLDDETRRTRAVRRGGQHPEWDEEVRFTLYEDVEDELARTAAGEGDEPPPPPPKKEKKKIKGTKKMQLMCYADDPREPDLIGETTVDLTEVLTKGETDEWFSLTNKEKYCGEVYLELTFWSNEKPPEKQAATKSSAFHPQYGGPGSFTPSSDVPASLRHGGSNENTPSPSRLPSNGGFDSGLPSSLKPSGSLANLNLYNAPYEQQSRYGDAVDKLSNGIASLDFDRSSGRRENFTPGISEFGYVGTLPQTGSFSTLSSSGSLSSIHSLGAPLGAGSSRGPHRGSLSSLHESFVQNDFIPGHSNPMQSVSETYPPEVQYHYPNGPSGFVAPPPAQTPVPQLGMTAPSPHQMPSGFALPQTTSAMGFHPPQPSQPYPIPSQGTFQPPSQGTFQPPSQGTFQPPSQSTFQPPYPQPPASAPPNRYIPPDGHPAPSSIPPLSYSAPPQQFIPQGTPPPPQLGLPPSNAYQQMQPSNPTPRPLPTPQVPPPQQTYNQPQPGFVAPTGVLPSGPLPSGPSQPAAQGSVVVPSASMFPSPGPPPPPPRRKDSFPPVHATPPVSFPPPPPPPPPLLQNEIQPPQQVSHIDPPPHLPPPSQLYDRQSSSSSSHWSHYSQPQPQPPHPSQGFGTIPPPPPPPPPPSNYTSPAVPPSLTNYTTAPSQGQHPQYPGAPPLPPAQFSSGPSWNTPPPHQDRWHT